MHVFGARPRLLSCLLGWAVEAARATGGVAAAARPLVNSSLSACTHTCHRDKAHEILVGGAGGVQHLSLDTIAGSGGSCHHGVGGGGGGGARRAPARLAAHPAAQ